jgi:hypothetical protein
MAYHHIVIKLLKNRHYASALLLPEIAGYFPPQYFYQANKFHGVRMSHYNEFSSV